MAAGTHFTLSFPTPSCLSSSQLRTSQSSLSVMANTNKKKMEDRISLLPDSLLLHILSPLNTKLVVQTCVLSKRWKTLWTRIQILNFDFHTYPFTNAYHYKQISFQHFVHRMLSEHCRRTVRKLSFASPDHDGNNFLIELVLCYARSHHVKHLSIDAYYVDSFDWKHCFSGYSSLTVLKIAYGFVDDWGVLALPSLRVLAIESNWEAQEDEDEADYVGVRMFSGCPNLESLVLINHFFVSATICAPKLEKFELCSSGYASSSPEVELMCASSLKSVTFRNLIPTVKSASEFSCIHKVNIAVHECEFERASNNILNSVEKFYELLKVFHNARCFTLPFKATQVVLSAPFDSEGLCFHNMTHLELKSDQKNKRIDLPITELAYLLKRPNLKTLAVVYEDNKYRTLRRYFNW